MPEPPVLKVVILGEGGVGKTSLVRRYCEGKFDQSRVMTIGVDFQTKLVNLSESAVKLSIWDMAGQPRFESIREGFYRGSLAAALVYDLEDLETLKLLGKWYREATRNAPKMRFMVVGNKADISAGDEPLGMKFAEMLGIPYVRTSAATGEGVAEMFRILGNIAYSHRLL